MEPKKTIIDYFSQVLVIFGFTMLVLNIFCFIFGNSAKDISAMFALGSQGIPLPVAFEFLCVSALTTIIRFVFFTDVLIKKMQLWLRTACMLASVVLVITLFIIAFHWFPITMWQPWAMFFLCFGIFFLGSYLVMALKEKSENRRMEEALQKLKDQEGN